MKPVFYSLTLGLVLIYAVFFIFSDAASSSAFEQVAPGLTENQVRAILGNPQHIRHDTNQPTVFFYGGILRGKWCTMEVYFGLDGSVTGKFHDH